MTQLASTNLRRLARMVALGGIAASLAGPGTPGRAQNLTAGHGGMDSGGAETQGTMDAMARMNRDMMAPGVATGDPDRDFVAMMIPHHQGAVDMARIYLRTGHDPYIRHMARKVVADQEREIRDMRTWQARHPTP